jgi:hypothetical protein
VSLAVTSLTSNSTASASFGGFTTASVSPAANSLLVLWVSGFDGSGTQDFTVSAVSGLGLTWTRQKLGVAGSTPKGDVECWTAPCGSSPGSGAITVTLTVGNVNGGVAWDVDQVTGQSASTPVVTGNTQATNNSSAASSATFGTAGNASNLFLYGSTVLIGTGQSVTQAASETPAWTQLAQQQSNTTTQNGVSLQTQVSPDATHLTASSSWTGSHSWGTIGIEIAAATGGTAHTATATLTVTPTFSATAARGHFRTASLTVTPSLSATARRGHFRTASLTVTPSLTATRRAAHVRTASLTVTPSFQALASGGQAKGERQLVRLAVASFFGGTLVTADAGVCFQGGPLTGNGLGTAYPYTVRHAPDEYYTTGMPDGQNWGCVLSTTRLERNTRLDSYGGKFSGYWERRYTIECELALICELPHIEVAGAGLDDLIDAMEAMVFADRTLGTNDGSKGVRIIQAGPGRAGIRDVTPKFEALDEVKGRYAAEATVTFEALVMIAA